MLQESSWSHKEYSCFDFAELSMFTFDEFWGCLGTSIFRNSSSAANNTRSKIPSWLSYRSLWLWLNHWKALFVANAILLIPFIKSVAVISLKCVLGIEECWPRTSKLQRNRNNVPSELISDYFKKVVMISLLHYLTVEIVRRFDHASVSVYSGLVIIPSKMVSLVYKKS